MKIEYGVAGLGPAGDEKKSRRNTSLDGVFQQSFGNAAIGRHSPYRTVI
jgi:hypothetical protein